MHLTSYLFYLTVRWTAFSASIFIHPFQHVRDFAFMPPLKKTVALSERFLSNMNLSSSMEIESKCRPWAWSHEKIRVSTTDSNIFHTLRMLHLQCSLPRQALSLKQRELDACRCFAAKRTQIVQLVQCRASVNTQWTMESAGSKKSHRVSQANHISQKMLPFWLMSRAWSWTLASQCMI